MHEVPRTIEEFQEIIDGKTGMNFDAVQLGAVALLLEYESHQKFVEDNDPYWGEDMSIMQSKAVIKAAELDPEAPTYDMTTLPDKDDLALAA